MQGTQSVLSKMTPVLQLTTLTIWPTNPGWWSMLCLLGARKLARPVGGPRVGSGTNCLFTVSDALRNLREDVEVRLSAAEAVPLVRAETLQHQRHKETPAKAPPMSPPLGGGDMAGELRRTEFLRAKPRGADAV